MRNFIELLRNKWIQGKFLCVGLDSEYAKIPEHIKGMDGNRTLRFNTDIIDATADLVCAFKPNIAFYSGHSAGDTTIRDTIEYIQKNFPDIPVILDSKRGDIGNTNAGYVEEAFGFLNADAVTVHPYLGQEAMQPFLDMKDKGVIVLCRTSNPGAGEFQDMMVHPGLTLRSAMPMYQYVSQRVANHWNTNGNCAIVVGATYPEELQAVRSIVGDMPILIPGVGFQQKNVPLETQVEQAVTNGQDSKGQGMIINSSRGIIFASSGPDFAQAARRETLKLHELINKFRKEI